MNPDLISLVRAVHDGQVTAAAQLLDLLEEQGDPRRVHLVALLGRCMHRLSSAIRLKTYLREGMKELFWPELAGGDVVAAI